MIIEFISNFTDLFFCADKFLHIFIGNFIFYFVWYITKSIKKSYLTVFFVALSKELFDIFNTKCIELENLMDLLFTLIII